MEEGKQLNVYYGGGEGGGINRNFLSGHEIQLINEKET